MSSLFLSHVGAHGCVARICQPWKLVFIYELITKSGSSRMSCDAVVKLWFLPKPHITIYLLASGMKWTLNSYLNKVGVDIVCKALYSALPQVFRKDELQKMLSLFRDTSLALLGSNLDPLGYDMTQKSWYHNTRSVLNRANVHNSLSRSYLSAQTLAWRSDHTEAMNSRVFEAEFHNILDWLPITSLLKFFQEWSFKRSPDVCEGLLEIVNNLPNVTTVR